MKLQLPFQPPVEPMLAKLASELPSGDGWLYEPKWDGFRALVFKSGDDLVIQSRDTKPLGRYFPELEAQLKRILPDRCVLDGEVVIVTNGKLDFDAMLLRIHPAASRVKLLSEQSPASYVAWDLLALGDEDLRQLPQSQRCERLRAALANVEPPVHLTPVTRDRAVAADWFARFEGAGLDGVMAKPESLTYTPGKRMMLKIKHQRTADCVVGGFRWYKGGKDKLLGSMLLGLYDGDGMLHHVGVCSGFKMTEREKLADLLRPYIEGARDAHPWREWAAFQDEASDQRMPGAKSRWTKKDKDLSWVPIRIELVCEVSYDHLQGDRFRHGTHFKRWRPDKPPADCRYDQLEVSPPFELLQIFGASS
ncbi:MAG TPA: ATP-dependent DNA ligase [Kofleriaceae bacterium]|nr:ATP-dependent DNA ligase [Kofleriaceae bacterium]